MNYPIQKLNKNDFPQLLQEITDPPSSLYIRGDLPQGDLKYLCVVGSRKNSQYGREVCETLIKGLQHQPIVIVSGLAYGIDAIAHQTALSVGLKTMAFPGSGLNDGVLYPRANLRLAMDILNQDGCIISESEPDFKARPESFPQRNRIMAGISHATLVIEASIKSGTLITSKLATHYNREVLAVPGDIFASGSAGPHMLIRLGATPVTGSQDILEALGFKIEEGASTLFDPNKYDSCSQSEIKVIEVLKDPIARESLIERLNNVMTISEINITLSLLEIKGLIKESLGEIRLK